MRRKKTSPTALAIIAGGVAGGVVLAGFLVWYVVVGVVKPKIEEATRPELLTVGQLTDELKKTISDIEHRPYFGRDEYVLETNALRGSWVIVTWETHYPDTQSGDKFSWKNFSFRPADADRRLFEKLRTVLR